MINFENEIFLISDTWLGRSNIIEIANRPFKTVKEMNETIISNWNNLVSPEDTVIHLGNFAWDPKTAKKALSKLNGNIFFMEGSSGDLPLAELQDDKKFKNKISFIENEILSITEHDVILSHYPLSAWLGDVSNTFHVHGYTTYSHFTDLTKMLRFNLCCDFWGFKPVKISTLKDLIYEQKKL